MIILNIPLFKGLTLEQIEDMKNKHCMTEKKYKKNSFIFRAGDIVHEIGIVLEGSINIEMIDMWDNKSILSNIDVGQIFAESYALCNEPMMVDAVATKDSTILMLNMRQIFAPINNNASWYNTFHKKEFNIINKNILHFVKKCSWTGFDLPVKPVHQTQ